MRRPAAAPHATAPEAIDPHALDCACPACAAVLARGSSPENQPGREGMYRYTRQVDFEVPVQEGDHVWVRDGVYRGCILDLVRREQWGPVQYWICRRTSFPSEIRTRNVSLYRRRAR